MSPAEADAIVARTLLGEYGRESTLAGVQLEHERRTDARWERVETWLLRAVCAAVAVLVLVQMWRATP